MIGDMKLEGKKKMKKDDHFLGAQTH